MQVLGVEGIDVKVEAFARNILVENEMQIMELLKHLRRRGRNARVIRAGFETKGIGGDIRPDKLKGQEKSGAKKR
jgi:hypothetical protein